MGWHDGRTAIVTGGAGGIGSAICAELGKDGAGVAIWDLDMERADELASRLPNARAYHVDITTRVEVDRAVERVEADFGGVHALINNAGISKVGDHTDQLSDEIWDESIAVMQTAVFYCSRAVGRKLITQGSGSVLNISSIRGLSPNPGRVAYCAAKAAVLMMTRVMACEWGPHGVRINAVSPGIVATGMWKEQVARGLCNEQEYIENIPSRRLAEPSEIGRLCSFLVSDDSAYINGACITIDGGLTQVPSG